jgi:hypothetical protein
MHMRKLFLLSLATTFLLGVALLTSCEGPMGPAGAAGKDGTDGTDGADGADANETCKECHNPETVDLISAQYEFSKHGYGETFFEEAGNTGCAPCHESEAFKDVVERAVPSTFTLAGNSYVNNYACSATTAYGAITCYTCHSSIHSTYQRSDIPAFTTVEPVSMTMWGGAKTIDLTLDGDGSSNLCVKCHQPRPFTNSNTDRNVLDYANLVANPADTFYSPTLATIVLKPGYRTHTHYGTIGAIYAGVGGIEFPGTLSYSSSQHTSQTTCADCHMAPMNGRAGGHTFFAKGNFNGCLDCHPNLTSATSDPSHWGDKRTEIQGLLNDLAATLNIGGVDILNRNPDAESNLWVSLTTNKYDGYLNIYDPINNPDGEANNPGMFRNPSPGSTWSQEQKDFNATLPVIKLTNAQMGAIINFQLCLREYSLGVHNFNYSKALLTNSLAILE